jgi:hypothetical protein
MAVEPFIFLLKEGGAAQLALAIGATTPTHPAHGEW